MRLHLGCSGDIREGWINIDAMKYKDAPNFIQYDLSKGLPSEVNNITEVYSCHVGEHFYHKDFVNLLKEIHSKMVPGATIRTGIPDFKKLVYYYLNRDWSFFEHCRSMAPNGQLMEIINGSIYQYDPNQPYEAHKCMYDPEYAIFTHKLAGFTDVEEVPFDPAYGDHGRKDYTFFTLAKK